MKQWITILTCSALVLGALAIPASADQHEGSDETTDQANDRAERSDKANDRAERKDMAQERMQEKRDAAKEKAQDRHDDKQERKADFASARAACKEAKENGTLNGTHGDCVSMAAKAKHDPESKARRAYHHLDNQIDAVEHRIAKLEIMEYRLEAALESGELNETQTNETQAKLVRVEATQGELVEKLIELYAKQAAIKDRVADSDKATDRASDADDDSDEVEQEGDHQDEGDVDDESEETDEADDSEEDSEEESDETDGV